MDKRNWTSSRRDVLRISAAVGLAGALFPAASIFAQTSLRPTPEQILGPFYPIGLAPNRTGNLTSTASGGRAKGQLLVVTGQVINIHGEPLRGAKVEVWQANSAGRYAHPTDTNAAPLDPNFEGFGQLTTDAEGRYRFMTIKPAAYPTGPNMFRPAHIHFDVAGRQDRLVTQMYFDGDPYNEKDRFLQSVRRPEALIVKLQPANLELDKEALVAVFDIILAKG
jgi:protocatechuate 3,4-dioxygenase beta subunit